MSPFYGLVVGQFIYYSDKGKDLSKTIRNTECYKQVIFCIIFMLDIQLNSSDMHKSVSESIFSDES